MIYAVIEGDTVKTVVEAGSDYRPGEGYVAVDATGIDVCGGWKWDGEKFIAPVQPHQLSTEMLASFKNDAKRSIDQAAEVERLKYITPGTGQAMTYQRKLEEARRLVALANAGEDYDADEFPMLAATVGIDGNTLDDVAELVVAMDAGWAAVGAAIESARMNGKAAIDQAEDEAGVIAVEVVWPSQP